jgi:hypothetical protein
MVEGFLIVLIRKQQVECTTMNKLDQEWLRNLPEFNSEQEIKDYLKNKFGDLVFVLSWNYDLLSLDNSAGSVYRILLDKDIYYKYQTQFDNHEYDCTNLEKPFHETYQDLYTMKDNANGNVKINFFGYEKYGQRLNLQWLRNLPKFHSDREATDYLKNEFNFIYVGSSSKGIYQFHLLLDETIYHKYQREFDYGDYDRNHLEKPFDETYEHFVIKENGDVGISIKRPGGPLIRYWAHSINEQN